MPLKSDSISLVSPEHPSLEELNLAVLLKSELLRNDFSVAEHVELARWALCFGLNREDYSSMVVGPQLWPSTRSEVVNNADVLIQLRLVRATDLEVHDAPAVWEASVRTSAHLYSVLPNATIKAIIDEYGKNFEHKKYLSKSYQAERDSNVDD